MSMKLKKMKLFWILLIVLALIIALSIFQIGSKKQNIPKCIDCNIIFIDIDVLRADHLGVYGYYRNTSPNIDAFAKKSILFKNAYSQSFTTSLSTESILTSFLPGWSKEKTKIPKPLKDYSYVTAAFVEKFNPDYLYQDFDVYLPVEDNGTYSSIYNIIFNYSLDYILKSKNNKFFSYLHSIDLHAPYHSKYEDYFDPDYNQDIYLIHQEYFNAMLNLSTKRKDRDFNDLKESLLKPEQINHIIAHYDGGILSVDELFGQFINRLNKTGLLNKTIIVLFSNHGEDLFENGRLEHYYTSNFVMHVPLIIYIPGIKPQSIDAPVALMDIMPTILDLIDIKMDIPMQGINLVPIIENPKSADKSRMIVGDRHIRKDNWLVIFHPTMQLYNLKYDINESNNLADKNPEIVEELLNEYNNILIKSYLQKNG